MKSKFHAIAGGLALLLISTFWISIIVSELIGSKSQIIGVKNAVLYGMFLLIPSLAATGASGFSLAGKWKSRIISTKKKRMKFAAINGIFILLPSAIFLADRAAKMNFDAIFAGVQTLEIIRARSTLLSCH